MPNAWPKLVVNGSTLRSLRAGIEPAHDLNRRISAEETKTSRGRGLR